MDIQRHSYKIRRVPEMQANRKTHSIILYDRRGKMDLIGSGVSNSFQQNIAAETPLPIHF